MAVLICLLKMDRAGRIQYGLIGGWVLAMISVPILKWEFGSGIVPLAITFALSIQFSTVAYSLWITWRWATGLYVFFIVIISTWVIEWIGSNYGFPFGDYTYTNLLQPQIAHVPVLVPLAWYMMLPCAWAIADIIIDRKNGFVFMLMSAAAMTAWDFFLDPQMTGWEFWVWNESGGYFGIPWVNYGGWFLTTCMVTWLVRPDKLPMPQLPLLIIYGLVWFLQMFGLAVFWGQPGPAFVGGCVMGVIFWWAVYKYRRQVLLK